MSDLAPIRALVVDDDVISRRVACAMLRDVGIGDPLQAGDGVEALAIVRDAIPPVDLAICDLEMHGMDGVELLAQLGAERPGMAVVLLSSLDGPLIAAVETMALSCGLRVLGAMRKPLVRDRLQAIVALLHRRAAIGPSPEPPTVTEDEILLGIEQHQFVPFFQPKVDVRTGTIRGAEALARWVHPDRGLVSPAAFIPLAEQSGLVCDLTWSILDETMRRQAEWRALGFDLPVSVNITVGFLEELAVTENVVALARRHGTPPGRIMFELTESMATTDVVAVIGNLVRLRMRGFGLAIDDFGTGYSSMQQLSRIPFSELKVDQSFVSGAAHQPHLRAILESSLQLGRRLGLVTTAEGVETAEDLELVRSFGCEIAQGWHFARPMPGDDLLAWSADWKEKCRAAEARPVECLPGPTAPADEARVRASARLAWLAGVR
jgi:EAL domain-containing protein (putative c-di-GMP-specific phosphodiesterase class I)/ActR/RegA family two-component response regulator